jgi:phage/plasmid-like protein (TIGR03299 family)
MAHLLNFNKKTGTWAFASNSEKAWHGLGQIVDKAMTAEEAIKNANLDYEVKKAPLFAGIEKGKQIEVESQPQEEVPQTQSLIYQPYDEKSATYRTDTNDVLGIVGGRYEIVQNYEAFGFFDSIIDSKEAIFETAGALGKGERIFVTAKLPNDLVVKGEPIEKYIILTNSHDGSSSIIAGFTNVRVVCNNTLQAALSKLDSKVSIKHISGAKDKLAEAHRVMGIASKYMDTVQEVFDAMSNKPISDEEMKNFLTKVFTPKIILPKTDEEKIEELSTRTQNMIESAFQFAMSHETQTTQSTKNTLFGAYNAVSGYYNYVKQFPTQESRFNSIQFGQAGNKIKEAFSLASNMLN